MQIQQAISQIMQHKSLTIDEAARAMELFMLGEATHSQMGALLVAMQMKGETIEEITGFARTMRTLSTKITTNRPCLVDTCGTGGDYSGTFNISTTAAFVVAGAGVSVAKHGNRSATSQCGSADVLEALGVNIEASPDRVGRCIDEIGIGFLFARTLHNAMKHVAPVRMELKVRTVFNILGPLTNPAGADGQVMGIFDGNLAEKVAGVLVQLGTRHAFVVHGRDGLDEISLSGPTLVAEATSGMVRTYEISPEQFGLNRVDNEVLKGGDAQVNAAILRQVLAGEPGPCRDIVCLNAAPAILAGGLAEDLQEAFARAKESIDTGAALEKLEALIRISHDS